MRIEISLRSQEETADAEQRQADHEQAGDGAAIKGRTEGGLGSDGGSLGRANVGDDRHAHSDEAGQHGTDRADEEADGGRAAGHPAEDHALGDKNKSEDQNRDDADCLDLAREIGLSAFLHCTGNFLHGRRARVHGLDLERKNHRGGDSYQAEDERGGYSVLEEKCIHNGKYENDDSMLREAEA